MKSWIGPVFAFVYLSLIVFTFLTVFVQEAYKETKYIIVVHNVKSEVKGIESKVDSKQYPEVPVELDEEVKEIIIEPEEVLDDILDDDTYLLAQIIHAEAKGEPYDGKVAVGNVVLNRVNSEGFPDDIESVIFQKNQFSPVNDGSIHNDPGEESIQAAKDVLNGNKMVDDIALYFYNPRTSTSQWIFTRTTIKDIGNHRFAY